MNQHDLDLLSNTRHLLEEFAANYSDSRIDSERLDGNYDEIRINLEKLIARKRESAFELCADCDGLGWIAQPGILRPGTSWACKSCNETGKAVQS